MPYWFMWPVPILSTAAFLFLWFKDVRRIMRERQSMVDSAGSQLETYRHAADGQTDPNTVAVLERSESIYLQAVDLYHQSLRRPWCRLPAALMGFRAIPLPPEETADPEDSAEPEAATESENIPAVEESAAAEEVSDQESNLPPVSEEIPAAPQKEPYIGSVRFFKNMILLTVIVMIAIPTALSVHLSKTLKQTNLWLQEQASQNDTLQQEKDALHESLLEAQDTLQKELENSPWREFRGESPYADLYPDFYAPQPLTAGTKEDGVIYLTFDDGPSARTTAVLDTLKEKNVKATFFVVGNSSQAGKDLMNRIVDEGHTLAMHTYSHNYTKIYSSVEDYLADMYQIFNLIKETTGVTPSLFRFPGGSINGYNRGLYQELISEMLRRGFIPYDWNISSADAASNQMVPVDTLINNVLSGARTTQRGIVLMHDSSAKLTTAQALPAMIDRLQEMGFELKALTPDVAPILYTYRE